MCFILLYRRQSNFWIGMQRLYGNCTGEYPVCKDGPITEICFEARFSALSDCCRCRHQFYWIDDQPMGYMGWATDETQGEAGRECGWLSFRRDYFWGDGFCVRSERFICKKNVTEGEFYVCNKSLFMFVHNQASRSTLTTTLTCI